MAKRVPFGRYDVELWTVCECGIRLSIESPEG
jgi:hypothetical protein